MSCAAFAGYENPEPDQVIAPFSNEIDDKGYADLMSIFSGG